MCNLITTKYEINRCQGSISNLESLKTFFCQNTGFNMLKYFVDLDDSVASERTSEEDILPIPISLYIKTW